LTDAKPVAEWTKSDLVRYVGGLSNPSKMPGYGYSLPARECTTGSKLRPVEGSTCSKCYAMKGRYGFKKVQSALYRRLESITSPLWVKAMSELIRRSNDSYFRWHDSGDLQSVDHLARIVEVCEETPDVSHWLPTREYAIVQRFIIDGRAIPENLNIRLSAHMIDGPAPAIIGLTASTVSTDEPMEGAHPCPSRHQGNKCGDCRACWDKGISLVDYKVH
jgi:hypothetical protein